MASFAATVFCVFPDCEGTWRGKATSDMEVISCNASEKHSFCAFCKTKPHPSLTCQQNLNSCQTENESNRLNRLAGYLQCPGCGIVVFNTEGCDWLTCLNPKCRRQFNPFHADETQAHSEYYPTFISDIDRSVFHNRTDLYRFLQKHALVVSKLGIDVQVGLIEKALIAYRDDRSDAHKQQLFKVVEQLPDHFSAMKKYFQQASQLSCQLEAFYERLGQIKNTQDLFDAILSSNLDEISQDDIDQVKLIQHMKKEGKPMFILQTKIRSIQNVVIKSNFKRLLV
mmetsp:Transcript_21647/g.32123  ORF Transcript_21647/g.32123 Transcript_21647/m.32123 type:complete len:283 (-) Transcript_21647:51-899(-)